MDKADLINYYKRPYFIFNSSSISIEDDEILDLDSISLDSNEDTWLWSNSRGTHYEEITPGEIKSRLENTSIDTTSTDFSRISLTNWDFKEETINDTFLDMKTPSHSQKLELKTSENTLPKTRVDEKGDRSTKSESDNALKQDSFLIEDEVFKKPILKRDISEKNSILYSIENKLFTLSDNDSNDPKRFQNREIKSAEAGDYRKVIDKLMSEKNYAMVNGTEKRRSLINESSPICHSTPMPILPKRRMNKLENERKALQKSNEESDSCTESPIVNSTFVKPGLTCVDSPSEPKVSEALTELSMKDDGNSSMLNSTYDVDDNASTSSSDSRRSSNNGNHLQKAILPRRSLSRPSSSSLKLNSDKNGNICNSSKLSNGIKAPFIESKMKQPSRRTPSLNRLQIPSLNIDEEFVSVVEIKSKDISASKNNNKKPANAPTSHIPRPSTRIPVFRNSVSCTRSMSKK